MKNMKMKHIFSMFAVCLVLAIISCGKGGDDCSADFVGDWTGEINCSGSGAAPITVSISQLMGDTLNINSNGENFTGVLDGCDLNLIPTELELSIFGTLTISGSIELKGDDLVFMQTRSSGGQDEVCTFLGQK